MSAARLKRFISEHHLKLWACGLGVIVVMSVAAATPPLSRNLVAGASNTTGSVSQIKPSANLLKVEAGSAVSPSTLNVQGTTPGSPISNYPGDTADQPVTPSIPVFSKTPVVCPLVAGGLVADNGCDCMGRGTMIACARPE